MIAPARDVFDAMARWRTAALAWEVLRRDPAYRAAYAALPTRADPDIAADAAFVARWGLHFR